MHTAHVMSSRNARYRRSRGRVAVALALGASLLAATLSTDQATAQGASDDGQAVVAGAMTWFSEIEDARRIATPQPAGPPSAESTPPELASDDGEARLALSDPDGFGAAASHPVLPWTFLSYPTTDEVLLVSDGTLRQIVTVPNGPDKIAISADGETVYFTSRFGPQIMAYDFLERGPDNVRTIRLDAQPYDIEVGGDGRIWILTDSELYAISPTGERITESVADLRVYSGEIEINAEGTRLYYAHHGLSPSTLFEIDTTQDPPVILHQTGHGDSGGNGQDLELSLDGSMLAFAAGSGQDPGYAIARYETNGLIPNGFWQTGAYPRAVGFSPDGRFIYTANTDRVVDIWETTSPYRKLASFSIGGEAFELHVESTGQVLFALSTDGIAYPLQTDEVREGVSFCAGAIVTVDVAAGDAQSAGIDVIAGTEGDDVIEIGPGSFNIACGFGGNDILRSASDHGTVLLGGDGDDVLQGGAAGDTLIGELGHDQLFGSAGPDYIDGGPGDDTAHGNRGADEIFGRDGDDRIFGYADDDLIEGGDGDDRLHGNFGNDEIYGNDGNDRIFGYGDDDILSGGNGADVIGGNFGNDTIYGGQGNDRLYGSDGTDDVRGGDGNDLVQGNSGNDRLFGSAGNDHLDGGINSDVCDGGSGTDTTARCETLREIP